MGLGLQTGMLSDLKIHDEEGYKEYKHYFVNVYQALMDNGIESKYCEPENLKEHDVWSCEMYGYSGLHYLRRLAAKLWNNEANITVGDKDSPEDPILTKYHNEFNEEPENIKQSFISKLFNTKKDNKPRVTFNHLILHGDAEGFYLPVDFDDIIVEPEDQFPSGIMGSSIQLKKELEIIADWLKLDLTKDIESEEIWSLPENHGIKNRDKWKIFGIESFSCIRLHKACVESIKNNTAIVFC